MIRNEIVQHNIVEKGLILFQSMVDRKSVVESTISQAIDNYIESRPKQRKISSTVIIATNPGDEKVNREELKVAHDKIITEHLQAVNRLNYLKLSSSCDYNDIYSVSPLYQNEARKIIEENNWLMNNE